MKRIRLFRPRAGRQVHAFAVAAFASIAPALPHHGHAQSLRVAWENARANEPTLQASKASLEAAEARTTQAYGALLPQLSATFSTNRNKRDYQQIQATGNTESLQKFGTTASALNLTQPLWRRANLASWSQAEDGQSQARHQVAATEQDLVGRFITAWFDVMAARDTLAFTREQTGAARLQNDIFRRGLTLGASNEVQRDDAAAKYEQALADEYGADADYDAKIAALEVFAGDMPGFAAPTLRSTTDRPEFMRLEPLDHWLTLAAAQNPAILAAEKALAAARQEVRKQQAQHEPTLDLVGSFARNDQADAGNFPGQSGFRTKQLSLGIQVAVPLYSGGSQSAKVREAAALARKAEFDLDAARRTTALKVKQAWAAARSALAKGSAGRLSVLAAETALRAALAAQRTGLKTAVEELQARQQLAGAHRDQLRARYDTIVSFVKLRAAIGEANDSMIASVQLALSDDNGLRLRVDPAMNPATRSR